MKFRQKMYFCYVSEFDFRNDIPIWEYFYKAYQNREP